MDEDFLVRRLEALEQQVAEGGPVGGEACRAALAEWRRREADEEFQLTLPTPISRVVFLTLCRCYGLTPYRAAKQRKTSVSVRAPSGFLYGVFRPRAEIMMNAMEEAAVETAQRVMEKWSAKVGQAESATSGGALDEAASGAAISGGDSQGRLMIES